MTIVSDLLTKIKRNQFGKSVSWMLSAQAANFFLQAATFVLLARLLGVREYGLYVGVFSMVNTLMPYSSLGAALLFMRYVNEDESAAPAYLGYTIAVTSAVTLLLAGLLFWLGPFVTGFSDRLMMVTLVFSNCLFNQLVLCASRIFQTYERMKMTSVLVFWTNLFRVVALTIMMVFFHTVSARSWSFVVLASSAFSAAIALVWVFRLVKGIEFSFSLVRRRVAEGLGFAFAGSAQYAYNDLDKTMLNHYGRVVEAGFYSLAYKVVDFATTPLGSIEAVLLPKFFKLGRVDRKALFQLVRKSIGLCMLLGIGIAGCLIITLPLVTRLAGPNFAQSANVIKWICFIPFLRGVHQLSGSTLTATGLQPYRTGTQVFVAIGNLILNILLIPTYGWKGAAWASLASDGMLGVLNVSALAWCARRYPTPESSRLVEREAA